MMKQGTARPRAVILAAAMSAAMLAMAACSPSEVDHWFPPTPGTYPVDADQPQMTTHETFNPSPSSYPPELTPPDTAAEPVQPPLPPATGNAYSPASYPPELGSTGTPTTEEMVGVNVCGQWVQMPKIGFVPSSTMIVRDFRGVNWAIGDRGRVIGTATPVNNQASDNPFRVELKWIISSPAHGTPATPPGTCPTTAATNDNPYTGPNMSFTGGGGE